MKVDNLRATLVDAGFVEFKSLLNSKFKYFFFEQNNIYVVLEECYENNINMVKIIGQFDFSSELYDLFSRHCFSGIAPCSQFPVYKMSAGYHLMRGSELLMEGLRSLLKQSPQQLNDAKYWDENLKDFLDVI